MDLVRRGRLSVQRVQLGAWDVIEQLAEMGGWSEEVTKGKKRSRVVEKEKDREGGEGERKRKKRDNRTG
jgi:hypothetical protein